MGQMQVAQLLQQKLQQEENIAQQDKQIVEGKLQSYDSLLESDPEIQKMLNEREVEGQQKLLVIVVTTRFPPLTHLAQQQVALLNKDESTVRWLLMNWKSR